MKWKTSSLIKSYSFTNYSSYFSSINKNRTISASSKSMRNFFQRQERFQTRMSTSRDKIRNYADEKTNSECTFTPDMSLSRSHSISLTHSYIKSRVRHASSSPIKFRSRKVDKKQIEKLYNDYKKRNKSKKKLREKFDNEDGITFNPKFTACPNYINTIEGDVILRSSRTLENRKDFVKTFNYLREMEFKRGQDISNKNKHKDLYEYCFSNIRKKNKIN